MDISCLLCHENTNKYGGRDVDIFLAKTQYWYILLNRVQETAGKNVPWSDRRHDLRTVYGQSFLSWHVARNAKRNRSSSAQVRREVEIIAIVDKSSQPPKDPASCFQQRRAICFEIVGSWYCCTCCPADLPFRQVCVYVRLNC